MAEARVAMDPLDGTNYPTWKLQMRMVLMKMGVWRIVEGTEVAPDEHDVAFRKYSERRDRALATIVLGVKTNLLYLISDPQDPLEVWNKLSNQCVCRWVCGCVFVWAMCVSLDFLRLSLEFPSRFFVV